MSEVIELLKLMREDIQKVSDKIEKTDDTLQKHIEREEDFLKAFPNEDPRAHRDAHDAWISESQERARMYREVKTKIVTGGVWAVFVAVCTACWVYFKDHLK
jgi:hemerythrin